VADKPWCCSDIEAAEKDGTIQWHPVASVCIVVKDGGLVPINFCPWCGRETPKTLYTSPAMLYRP